MAVADCSRFLTIPYGYMETGQPGDCRRSTQIVADSRRHSYDYGNQALEWTTETFENDDVQNTQSPAELLFSQ